MTPRELGARWLAAGGGWSPGMRVLAVPDSPEGERDLESGATTEPAGPAYVVAVDKDGATVAWSEYPGTADGGLTLSDDVPDVTDPATLGAMLGVLRGVFGRPHLHAVARHTFPKEGDAGWRWAIDLPNGHVYERTEAEAMVAAMEARKRG